MPMYEFKVRAKDGTIHHVEEMRSFSRRDDPVDLDGETYPVVELEPHTIGEAESVLAPGSAFRMVSFSHAYMKADGYQKSMPKRPGMSGCSYPGRTWPAARGDSSIIR